MKIAFVTDDGINITQHFGRAGKYLVVEIDNGKELSRDLRDKFGHTHFHKPGEHADHGEQDHDSAENHQKHVQMMDAIMDCDVVVCGGMGQGAFVSITSMGKEVFMTDNLQIDSALKGYIEGKLVNMRDLVH